jgi:chromosome condensin MukBEF ATPase and DNA-binding subunit MukB
VLLAEHVDRLPRNRAQPLLGLEQRLAMSLLYDIRMVDVPMLADLHARGQSAPLVELLAGLEERLPKLSDAVNHLYLIHAGPAHQLTEIRLETQP